MKASNGWNMYVFRDGRHFLPGPTLARDLAAAIQACAAGDVARNHLMEALLRAGELECALADQSAAECHAASARLARVTDATAAALVNARAVDPAALAPLLPDTVPAQLQVSPPEGFAYYALHPRDFAELTFRCELHSSHAAVIGIRSIGATLSAVVLAACRARGLTAERITVRPNGHPYDRRCTFTPEQTAWLERFRAEDAEFLVADEGPGMSGSSFLSVADALVAAGVPRERITLLCSRQPDASQLRAPDGPARWMSYRSRWVYPNSFLPHDANVYVGAGEWRKLLLDGREWPESWIQMERLKFFTPNHGTLYKFEGFGRFGRAVHERAVVSREAGFGPPVGNPLCGFGVYPIVPGRMLTRADLDAAVIRRIADYCAFRAREFVVLTGEACSDLATMARFNFQEEFGSEVELEAELLLTDAPIIADARMQPHEWLATADGLLKLDGTSHGDDHFFPGPTDVAWDLAGAVVEWQMDAAATEQLLREYAHAAGDAAGRDARRRLPAFLLAYTVFRMGYCKMAADAVRGSGEEHRLWRAYERYRERVIAPSENEIPDDALAA